MTPIFGPTRTTLMLAEDWAIERGAHPRFVNVIPIYFELCPIYEIPVENGLGQAWKETGGGHFKGVVPPGHHNWCGLKTKNGTSNTDPEHHQKFPNDRAGVEAHLQHLARYGGKKKIPDGRVLLDPRWHLVTKFTDTMEGLGGEESWAPSPTYGVETVKIIQSIPVKDAPVDLPQIQIPGVEIAWAPADGRHYTKGRTASVKQIVHHHTDGWDSLTWLTTSPSSDVSAHFLVSHEGDRIWQLVRLEDTAHTQGNHNPWSVGIEWERKWPDQEKVPEKVYDTLAKLDVAIYDYILKHKLGVMLLNRQHILRHGEVNNTGCPMNLDVERIAKAARNISADRVITFDNGFALTHGFADFYRSLGDRAWAAVGWPVDWEQPEISNGESLVTVQRTDVGWLQYTPGTGEVRMATRTQQQAIERDLGISKEINLTREKARSMGEQLIVLGNELRSA